MARASARNFAMATAALVEPISRASRLVSFFNTRFTVPVLPA